LGGPDTATRSKVIWQIKTSDVLPELAGSTGKKTVERGAWRQHVIEKLQLANRGLLKARVRPQDVSSDPCVTSPKSQYRGAENQLYRIEIQRRGIAWDGTDKNKSTRATFKWSRENGSVVFPIARLNGTKVTLESLGRDDRLGLKIGDWVEVVDDDYALQGKADPLLQITNIDQTERVVTLSDSPTATPSKHPLLRRWDHQAGDVKQDGLTLNEGAALIAEPADDEQWLSLEDGIQIQFQPSAAPSNPAQYRTGDYWLIPARVATGNVEWPNLRDAKQQAQPIALPPHGVEHHYAPLAIISLNATGNVTITEPNLRCTFAPIAK